MGMSVPLLSHQHRSSKADSNQLRALQWTTLDILRSNVQTAGQTLPSRPASSSHTTQFTSALSEFFSVFRRENVPRANVDEFNQETIQQALVLPSANRPTLSAVRRINLKQRMRNAFDASNEPNWDSYGAAAASADSLVHALQFVDRLPPDALTAEVGVDPDGEISLEWYLDRWHVFSVSVSRDGALAFAGLYGESRVHGTERPDGDLSFLVDGIRRLRHR